MIRGPPKSALFPYPTLCRSRPPVDDADRLLRAHDADLGARPGEGQVGAQRPRVHRDVGAARSEEHTSELQSRQYLVCRLLLEKKKKTGLRALNTSTSVFVIR